MRISRPRRRGQRRPRGAFAGRPPRHRLLPCANAASCRSAASRPGAGADLRQHAEPLDRPAQRRQHAAPGDIQRPAVRQRQDGLHQTLPQRGAAHHHGAALVGQGGGQDFRGAGGAAIDQHHHRQAARDVLAIGAEHVRRPCGSRPVVQATTPCGSTAEAAAAAWPAPRRDCRAGPAPGRARADPAGPASPRRIAAASCRAGAAGEPAIAQHQRRCRCGAPHGLRAVSAARASRRVRIAAVAAAHRQRHRAAIRVRPGWPRPSAGSQPATPLAIDGQQRVAGRSPAWPGGAVRAAPNRDAKLSPRSARLMPMPARPERASCSAAASAGGA